MILTRLELFFRSRDLVMAEVARSAGYTERHLRRLREEEITATRGGIHSVTSAVRKLTHERVRPGALFERADAFLLKGSGRVLVEAHRQDLDVLKALLADRATSQLDEAIRTTGIASEAAIRLLLRAARALLDRDPTAADATYDAAAKMADTLRGTPPQLAASLQAHAYRGRAEAMKMIGSLENALAYLERASERFVDAGLCTEDAARVAFTRAAILAEMEMWDDALPFAQVARRLAMQVGNTELAANAELIEAAVQYERGAPDDAYKHWFRLAKAMHPPKSRKAEEELARVWMNLGMCEIRRKHAAEALGWLTEAEAAFSRLGNTAEHARTLWNMATHVRTFDSPTRSLSIFREAYRGFHGLQMWMDAGCVGLDMTDVMILTKASDLALARHARGVADTFARLPFATELRPALDQLRRIAGQKTLKDRHRVVRRMRTAFRDAKGRCSEVSVAGVSGAGRGKAG